MRASQGALFAEAPLEPPAPPPAAPPAPATPPPSAPRAAVCLAVAEVLSLVPEMLARLPEASTLGVAQLDGRGTWWVTTGRATYTSLREAHEVVLTGRELGVLALAAELDRASRVWLAEWLERRRADGGILLDIATALGGLVDTRPPPARRWPLGRVLRAYGAELVHVAVGDGASAERLA